MKCINIKKISKENIFDNDFCNLEKNNKIEFKSSRKGGLAIIYAPNGTGKTTLTRLLDKRKENYGEIDIDIDGKSIEESLNDIYVIYDQNSRHIIQGEANDFILSNDIVKIKSLEKMIHTNSFEFYNKLKTLLKNKYNIKTKTDILIENLGDLESIIKQFVNSRYVFKLDDITKLLVKNYEKKLISCDLDEEKLKYIIDNYHKSKCILDKVLSINKCKVKKDTNLKIVGETAEAIEILDKYKYKKECIVCDHEINSEELLNTKKDKKQTLSEKLDDYTKKYILEILEKLDFNEPFKIKEILLESIDSGNVELINKLQSDIKNYINNIRNEIYNSVVDQLNSLDIKESINELEKLTKGQPELSGDDINYLKEIIDAHIDKDLKIEFDDKDNKKLKITLDGEGLLNENRENLKLSTGEQNFISLAFEFMRAKHITEQIIVIDDPISSFDSIYKNKIIFCINNLANEKNCIILTHNIDLVQLIEAQIGGSYNLYAFQNKESGENGFIKIDNCERTIILKLNKLIDFFRADIFNEIEDKRLFFISMVPFIRGYCNINGNTLIYEKLSSIMHYEEGEKINLTEIYNKVFMSSYLEMNEKSEKESIKKLKQKIDGIKIEEIVLCCSNDIIAIIDEGIEKIKIFKERTKYRLLDKTLRHNLVYLGLRLKVEKTLFSIKPELRTQGNLKLGQLICKTLDNEEKDRIFFMSRKTLVNDFNHFEGNMDIFQPAIDIKDSALKDECNKILDKLNNLEARMEIKKKIDIKDVINNPIKSKK